MPNCQSCAVDEPFQDLQASNSGTFLPEWRPEISAQRNSELLNWKVAVFLRCTFIKNQARHSKTTKKGPLWQRWQSAVVTCIWSALCSRSCFRVLSKVSGFIERNTHDKRFMSGYKWNRDNLSSYQESSQFFLQNFQHHMNSAGFCIPVPGPAVLISWPHCCSVLERSWATACWHSVIFPRSLVVTYWHHGCLV